MKCPKGLDGHDDHRLCLECGVFWCVNCNPPEDAGCPWPHEDEGDPREEALTDAERNPSMGSLEGGW